MLDTSTLSRDGSFKLSKTLTDDILPSYKVLILGDPGIGKTSLVHRYISNEFIEDKESTIGLDYKAKKVTVSPNDKIILKLWDTAGSEKFHSIAQNYFANCDGILLCFDISDNNTFNNLYSWINYINDYVKIIENNDAIEDKKETQEEEEDENKLEKVAIKWFNDEQKRPVIVLAGTKSDLEEKKVNNEDIEKLKNYLNCEYFETSSKNGNGVDDLFFYMAKELFEKIDLNKNKKEGGFKLENKRIDEEEENEGNCKSKIPCC